MNSINVYIHDHCVTFVTVGKSTLPYCNVIFKKTFELSYHFLSIVLQEVETKIESFKNFLNSKLQEFPSPLEEQKKIIRYFVKPSMRFYSKAPVITNNWCLIYNLWCCSFIKVVISVYQCMMCLYCYCVDIWLS